MSSRNWGWLLFFALLVPVLAGCATNVELGKPTLVLNVVSGPDDPHPATMAFQLAGHGLDAGREVVLFFNVKAPVLATNLEAAKKRFQENPPLAEMRDALMAKGAKVLVCPHCLEALELKKEQLAPGAEIASKETLFSRLGANTVVFTY